jgi:5-methylcytosine-specific restriction endonuclease McrA
MSDPNLVDAIGILANQLGFQSTDALQQKLDELRARNFLCQFPSGLLSTRQRTDYLTFVLGRPPTELEVERSVRSARNRRASATEREQLESRQSDRCAVCGSFLSGSTSPHIDHVVPIALGGADDDINNLQLLCRRCNLGKGKLPSWHLGVPYLEHRLTPRLRYCVFARAGARCQADGCVIGANSDELEVVQRIPNRLGGGWQFDNLLSVCSVHKGEFKDRTIPNTAVVREKGQLYRGGMIRRTRP